MSNEEESARINVLLLEKIKNCTIKKYFFFTDHGFPIFNSYQSVEKLYNLNLIPFPKNRFYKVFSHKSSLGNEIIAKVYFNALIGGGE